MTRRALLAVALAAAVLSASLVPAQDTPPGGKPRDVGLVETAGTRLAQLDVSVSGPRETIESLGPADFEIKVNRRVIGSFLVDRVCSPEPVLVTTSDREKPPGPAPAPPPRRPPVSFLLYFDQPYLTMAGRQRAMDLARELIPKIMTGGNRAMVLSNSRAVNTVAAFSSDAAELLGAIGRLEADRQQWDYYPTLERSRLEEVQRELNKEGVDRAIGLARVYYQEDRWRGERDIRRLAMSLGTLSDVDPPKAVLYFADTMRENPGDHYLKLFSDAALDDAGLKPYEVHLLDRVIQEAAAHGIRFYPIQAEGLVGPSQNSGLSLSGSYSSGGVRGAVVGGARIQETPSLIGVKDAQKSLTGLALETGGQAFLNGVPSDRIAERLAADLSCLYLISFDPTGFPEDVPLAVVVSTRRPGVTARVRGQLVIQSEAARRTSRLLAAFVNPEASRNDVPIRASLVPTGFADGAFTALVQVAVPGISVPGAVWDIGASLVTHERVREEGSARISVGGSGGGLVAFEQQMRFSPGRYELVAVAHHATSGQVASRRDEGTFPDPNSAEATIGPIAVLQPALGAFVRDGKTATSGTLAQSDEDAVRTDRPTALVGIVCRSRTGKSRLRLERTLVGESSAEFAPIDIDMGGDRCAQFRDLLPAGTMSSGYFRYEVRVFDGTDEVARAERTFPAGGASAPAGDSR